MSTPVIQIAPLARVCSFCGFASESNRSRCERCHRWGTFQESSDDAQAIWAPKKMSQISMDKVSRVRLREPALDAFFSGGPVRSCSYLMSGPPGFGKSSFALQAAQFFESPLYITAEEKPGALKARMKRFKIDLPNIEVVETCDLEMVARHMTDAYDGVIYDSAHYMITDESNGSAGSASQTLAVGKLVHDMAMKLGHVAFLIGHVNADGEESGMISLQHAMTGVILGEICGGSQRRMRMKKHREGKAGLILECDLTETGLDHFTLIDPAEESVTRNAARRSRSDSRSERS